MEERIQVVPIETGSSAAALQLGESRQALTCRFAIRDGTTDVRRLIEPIAESYAQNRLHDETFNVLAVFDDDETGIAQDKLDQFFKRCHPFALYDTDINPDFDEKSLEPIAVLGIEDASDRDRGDRVLRGRDYETVSTGDKSMVIAVNIRHGLNPFFIRGMNDYYASYLKYKPRQDEPVHLDKRWISDLANCPISPDEFKSMNGESSPSSDK
ncbi:MAG: hypothetical protein IPO15_00005 [Anaerolineae bacterium]|uniref:hypothetical protein n=1 Tax=Candidatus Amarolinea dominans TaxID=3140696 RepID=UPI003134C53D|nr:hypothetical protein [Anaerolineae bacterium]